MSAHFKVFVPLDNLLLFYTFPEEIQMSSVFSSTISQSDLRSQMHLRVLAVPKDEVPPNPGKSSSSPPISIDNIRTPPPRNGNKSTISAHARQLSAVCLQRAPKANCANSQKRMREQINTTRRITAFFTRRHFKTSTKEATGSHFV